MKKIIYIVPLIIAMAGCSSGKSAATAAPTATATPAAVQSTSQTAPVTRVYEGVILSNDETTVTLLNEGKETSYTKGEGIKQDGVAVRGSYASVTTYVDSNGKTAVSFLSVQRNPMTRGYITKETDTSITVSNQPTGGQETAFAIGKTFLCEDGIKNPDDLVELNYTGTQGNDAAIFYVSKVEDEKLEIVEGTIDDIAMSTIQVKGYALGAVVSCEKGDNFKTEGTPAIGNEVILKYRTDGDRKIAELAIVNENPQWVPATLTKDDEGTVTIETENGGEAQKKTMTLEKMMDCVTDQDIKEGDAVKVYYEGDLEKDAQVYAILKG